MPSQDYILLKVYYIIYEKKDVEKNQLRESHVTAEQHIVLSNTKMMMTDTDWTLLSSWSSMDNKFEWNKVRMKMFEIEEFWKFQPFKN